jgi:hypothetical protein
MRIPYGIKRRLLTTFALMCGIAASPAFSLLGPYAKWMDTTNGYRQPGDIGGPMNIGQGYRWNVIHAVRVDVA